MNYARMQEIETVVAGKVARIRKTKGKEYATDEDTLADFFEVAAEAGITPLQCWLTYVQKHQRAISTFVREGSTKSESIEERIIDVIVYHILLLGILEDLRTQEMVDDSTVIFHPIDPMQVEASAGTVSGAGAIGYDD